MLKFQNFICAHEMSQSWYLECYKKWDFSFEHDNELFEWEIGRKGKLKELSRTAASGNANSQLQSQDPILTRQLLPNSGIGRNQENVEFVNFKILFTAYFL